MNSRKGPSTRFFKIAVLGDGGVGKTALVIQFCLKHFVETYDPTIEDSYKTHFLVDQKPCFIDVLDTAGQEEYTALRDQWIRDSEAFILVYSISSLSSFGRMKEFHHQVHRIKDLRGAVGTPICIVGNKSDRFTEREVTVAEGITLAHELGCGFAETSAKNNENLQMVFSDIVRRLRTVEAARPQLVQASTKYGKGSHSSVLRLFRRPKSSIDSSHGENIVDLVALNRSLIEASRNNDERTVKILINRGANPDGQSESDGGAIHAAAAFGHSNIVNILLKKGAAINAKGPREITPLQAAALEGHSAVVRLLLHKGAVINETCGLHGTALSAATSRAKVDVVEVLLKKGADANIRGGPYDNALQAAAIVLNPRVAELLLNSGAAINARGEGDCTALQVASFAGNVEIVRLLLIRGAQIDAPGGKYGSALQAANDHGRFQVVKLLIEFGASTAALGIPRQNLSSSFQGSHDNIDNAWQMATQTPPVSGQAMSIPSNYSLQRIQVEDSTHHSIRSNSMGAVRRPEISIVGFSTICDPIGANVDIVFVHGLQGHPEKAWTFFPPATPNIRKKSLLSSSTNNRSIPYQESVYWPYDLLSKHPSFVRARLLTWGYDTQVLHFFGASNQQNISRHGNDLMIALQQERKNDPTRPVIFVAHSLGGILVKVALENSKRSTHQPQYLDIYTFTRGIVFLGTPHRGSVGAGWGVLAANLAKVALQGPNERVLRGLSINSESLENLRQNFLQMLEDGKFHVRSFYETKPMSGLYGLEKEVVPYDSAQVGHARYEVFSSINGNHLEICKFAKSSDAGYKAIVGALEDYIRTATTATTMTATTDATDEEA